MKGRLLLLILLSVDFAPAQVEHGTIGVIFLGDQKIIMAADSRSVPYFNNPHSHSVWISQSLAKGRCM